MPLAMMSNRTHQKVDRRARYPTGAALIAHVCRFLVVTHIERRLWIVSEFVKNSSIAFCFANAREKLLPNRADDLSASLAD